MDMYPTLPQAPSDADDLREPIRPTVIYAPKINNRNPGRLGRAELLSALDKEVYITCGMSVVRPEATAKLFLTRKGELLDPNDPLQEFPIVEETDALLFRVLGSTIAGEPNGDGFTGDGEHEAVVRLEYPGGSYTDSPATDVTVKCSLPGGTAKDDGSTQWQNENLAAPRVSPNPVPENHDAPVSLALDRYDVCKAGDVVVFEWGGEKISFTVSDPTQGVSADVPWEAVLRVGGGSVPLTWSVSDVVGNWSRHAPSIRVDVEIDSGTLRVPELHYEKDTPVVDPLDLTRLAGKSFFLHLIGSTGVAPGDVVTAHWKATLTDGSTREHDFTRVTWPDPFVELNIDVPYTYAEEAAGGTVAIWYTLNNDAKRSRTQRYRVTDVPPAKLAPPVVTGRNGDELDPFAQGAYIRIAAPHSPLYMLQGAVVTMTVFGYPRAAAGYWSEDYRLTSDDLGKDIEFFCPASELQKVENGSADFLYEIAPPAALVASYPGGIRAATKVSETLTLQIRRVGAPPNYAAPTDVNVKNGVLDPELPVTIVTIPLPAQGGPAVDSKVTLDWIGKPPYHSEGTVPKTGSLTFRINASHIGGSIGTTVNASYHDASGRLSETLTFRVGEPLTLPAPTVDEAAADTLYPVAAANGATVRITAELTTDSFIVVHFGEWDSERTSWQPGLGITVPAGEIAKHLGEAVTVSYTVEGTTSAVLLLHVLNFAENDPQLPPPIIPLAEDGVLDLIANPREIPTTTAPWPLIAQGQKVWLEIHASDDATPLVLWEASGVSSSEVTRGLSKAITRTWLDARANGSTITPKLWVTFDRSDNEAKKVGFPSRTYTIRSVSPAPLSEDFESLEVDTVYTNDIVCPGLTVLATDEQPCRAIQGDLYQMPYLTGKCITAFYATAPIMIDLREEYTHVRFGVFADGRSLAVSSFTAQMEFINTQQNFKTPLWVECSALGDRKVRYIKIFPTGGGMAFDNFTFSR